MAKVIYRKKNDLVSPTLSFSSKDGSEIILQDGIPQEIADETYSWLQENDEEFKNCVEQNLILKTGVGDGGDSGKESESAKTPPVPPEDTPLDVPVENKLETGELTATTTTTVKKK